MPRKKISLVIGELTESQQGSVADAGPELNQCNYALAVHNLRDVVEYVSHLSLLANEGIPNMEHSLKLIMQIPLEL